MTSRLPDVAVVGAGPAGLYAALLLAEAGFDVLVLEEHDTPGLPAHCTGVISDEVSDLFKVPEALVLARPRRCRVVAPSGRDVAFAPGGPGIAVIDRGQLDAELALAARRAGVEIRTGLRVEGIRVDGREVCVSGGGVAIRARAAILACGVAYGLHRQLGLGLPSLFLHSAQLEVDAAAPLDAVELHPGAAVAPEGFAWLVPVARDGRPRLKVGVMARGDAAEHLRRFAGGPRAARVASPDDAVPLRRLLPLGPVERTYGERIVAVGDAAGLTKPTTGGGIFYSLLSGLIAAETLDQALRRDRLAAPDLRAYERGWRARLDPHLRVSSYVRRVFMKLGDADLEALIQALGEDDMGALLEGTAHFNWQGDVIRTALRRRGVRAVLLHALLR